MDSNEQIKNVELVPVKELRPNPKNRNRHPEDQINRLAAMIEYQGFRLPIVVSNRTGLIVAGHGRLSAAKKLGLKFVPVSFQDFDDEDAEYAFMVGDNGIASWAELDLSAINADLGDLGPDFDIDMLGLKDFELEPADKFVDEVNKGDENSEWVDMPEFVAGNKVPKIILVFKSEEDREQYGRDNDLAPTQKYAGQWIIKK